MLNPEPVIGTYHNRVAICRDYDPLTPEVAHLIRQLILSRLPSMTVEHIGSTAVEGCAGKGIIDLMLLYPHGQPEAARSLLDSLGFQRQSTRDPFPEERPMRVGSLQYQGRNFQLHIHVIAASAQEAVELLAFRDRLREDAALRAAYVKRKQEIIAAGVTDSIDYSIAKGTFVEEVILSMK